MKKEERKKKTRSERFAILMATLQEIFCPGKPISSHKVKIYDKLLEPFSIEAIENAAEKIIQTKRIHAFPLPTEFFEFFTLSEDKLSIDSLALWNEACQLALTSNYPSENEELNRAIRIAFGSWKNFGDTDPTNTFDRKHFIETYKRMRRQEHERKLLDEGERKKLEDKK